MTAWACEDKGADHATKAQPDMRADRHHRNQKRPPPTLEVRGSDHSPSTCTHAHGTATAARRSKGTERSCKTMHSGLSNAQSSSQAPPVHAWEPKRKQAPQTASAKRLCSWLLHGGALRDEADGINAADAALGGGHACRRGRALVTRDRVREHGTAAVVHNSNGAHGQGRDTPAGRGSRAAHRVLEGHRRSGLGRR